MAVHVGRVGADCLSTESKFCVRACRWMQQRITDTRKHCNIRTNLKCKLFYVRFLKLRQNTHVKYAFLLFKLRKYKHK